MEQPNAEFKDRVYEVVASIPSGKVMSYSAIAALAGSPRAARVVGGVAHFGDPEMPWHRVVKVSGRTASGYPGGRKAQQKHLEAEGVIFVGGVIDMEKYAWQQ